MSDEFNKLDDWMMEIVKPEREKRLSEEDLKGFHDDVMKRVIERQNRGFGSPYVGFAFAAALSLAVIFGAVLYMRSVNIEKEKIAETGGPVKTNAEKKPAPQYAAIDKRDSGKEFLSGSLSNASLPQAAPLTEANILDEIEALKELGSWTEEDEAEAGIPADVTFADLEVGGQTNQPQVPAPQAVS
jgi:hypothetical protein